MADTTIDDANYASADVQIAIDDALSVLADTADELEAALAKATPSE